MDRKHWSEVGQAWEELEVTMWRSRGLSRPRRCVACRTVHIERHRFNSLRLTHHPKRHQTTPRAKRSLGVSFDEVAVADEGCGYADEGEEVVGLGSPAGKAPTTRPAPTAQPDRHALLNNQQHYKKRRLWLGTDGSLRPRSAPVTGYRSECGGIRAFRRCRSCQRCRRRSGGRAG